MSATLITMKVFIQLTLAGICSISSSAWAQNSDQALRLDSGAPEPSVQSEDPPHNLATIAPHPQAPAPLAETAPSAKEQKQNPNLWIPGYWSWAGASFQWRPGGWVKPLQGYHYVPAHWEHQDSWHFVEGGFAKDGQDQVSIFVTPTPPKAPEPKSKDSVVLQSSSTTDRIIYSQPRPGYGYYGWSYGWPYYGWGVSWGTRPRYRGYRHRSFRTPRRDIRHGHYRRPQHAPRAYRRRR